MIYYAVNNYYSSYNINKSYKKYKKEAGNQTVIPNLRIKWMRILYNIEIYHDIRWIIRLLDDRQFFREVSLLSFHITPYLLIANPVLEITTLLLC